MKPFNLEDALAGKPCFSKRFGEVYKVIKMTRPLYTKKVYVSFQYEGSQFFNENGRFSSAGNENPDYDLFMA